MILVCDLHDLHDLFPVAVDAVILEDSVVLVHGEAAVAVDVSTLKEKNEREIEGFLFGTECREKKFFLIAIVAPRPTKQVFQLAKSPEA